MPSFFKSKPCPPCPPCPELAELFTEFVNNNLRTLLSSIDKEEVKKGLILQLFGGAFPDLTIDNKLDQSKHILKSSLVSIYNKMDELNPLINYTLNVNIKKTGGSKKRKQIHKKKSKKSRKPKKLN